MSNDAQVILVFVLVYLFILIQFLGWKIRKLEKKLNPQEFITNNILSINKYRKLQTPGPEAWKSPDAKYHTPDIPESYLKENDG